MSEKRHDYRVETRLIHGRMHSEHWRYENHIVPPISSSAAYRLESAERGAEGFAEFANPDLDRNQQPTIYIYDRLDEPSRGMLEENLAIAEGGESCVTFATGMAAISAALGVLVKAGDSIVSHHTIYGCTYSLFTNWLPRFDVAVHFVDLTDLGALERLLAEDPRVMVVYGESPSNPTLEILDLRAIAGVVAATNARRPPRRLVFTVLDNTFATPFCQRPLEHGFDIAVHSLTKNIGGFGTDMGGAVIGPRLLEPDLLLYRKDFGAALSPKAAWPALVYGLPTLALRARRQMETALVVARHLEGHPGVRRVSYPGLDSHPQHELAKRQMRDHEGRFAPGTMISFTLEGEGEEARRRGAELMDYLADHALTVTLAVSLGQIRTLIEHPSSMTHAAIPVEDQVEAGIEPGGIRLSIGLEHPDDIVADLERGFEAIGRGAGAVREENAVAVG
jgi:cystathionine beta-lyase/cystathionine gamma-synthase